MLVVSMVISIYVDLINNKASVSSTAIQRLCISWHPVYSKSTDIAWHPMDFHNSALIAPTDFTSVPLPDHVYPYLSPSMPWFSV